MKLPGETRGIGKAEWALRPCKLSAGCAGFAVIFDMGLGCFRSVVQCVFMVTAG